MIDNPNDYDYSYGNADIMLYNVTIMHMKYKPFLDYIFSPVNQEKGLHFAEYGSGDQGL